MERLKEIERSIIKKYRKEIWSKYVKGVKEFEMIKENDKIAVCISGGKDSFLLAKCMQELKAHGKKLFYYDNKSKGEVDFLIDDTKTLSVIPIEVKSGRDFMVHSSLNTFTTNEDYGVKKAYVLSNSGTVLKKGIITYISISNDAFVSYNCFN